MENHTAKHFVLQLGSLISLYLSLSFLLALIFGVVNLKFPDVAESIWEIESSSSQVRLGIAMTIVFFPTYIFLTRYVNKTRRQDPQGSYLALTKWLIYLSLLIGGVALLVDLVVVIMTFLEGEITERFLLKAFSVLLIIGAAFYYYLLDARGVWLKNEKQSKLYATAAGVIVVVSIIFGFILVETPAEVREQRIDATQVTDLQNIQWQIQDYLAINGTLPENLNLLAGVNLPEAPEGRDAYEYKLTDKGFELCATFAATSRAGEFFTGASMVMKPGEDPAIVNPDNWEHEAGEWCFERVVK
jgi:hypothetical protein